MKKILIIEDDSFLQGMEVTELKKSGFEVSIAVDGKSGLASVLKDPVDCVLLDLMLPGEVDGMGVLAGMKKDDNAKKIPVIVFSNMADGDSYKKVMDMGATDFVIKSSVTLPELTEKIQKVLK